MQVGSRLVKLFEKLSLRWEALGSELGLVLKLSHVIRTWRAGTVEVEVVWKGWCWLCVQGCPTRWSTTTCCRWRWRTCWSGCWWCRCPCTRRSRAAGCSATSCAASPATSKSRSGPSQSTPSCGSPLTVISPSGSLSDMRRLVRR